jgi:hypothetical protein
MVRPTSAADINSLGPLRKAASPVALMRDLDLLLRLSGRIVKGCRLRGSVPLLACDDGAGHAGVAPTRRREGIERHVCHRNPPVTEYADVPASERLPVTALAQERLVISSERATT